MCPALLRTFFLTSLRSRGSPTISCHMLLMREIILLKDVNHDRKDQYFNLADGKGKSWLAHRYEYVRSSTQ